MSARTDPRLLKPVFYLLSLLAAITVSAQSVDMKSKTGRTRNIAWYSPSGASQVNGLSVGAQLLNVKKGNVVANGVNAEAGLVTLLVLPYFIHDVLSAEKEHTFINLHPDSANNKINGLTLSFGGNVACSVNGISLSGLTASMASVNGIAISGFSSLTYQFRGISIAGFMNRSLYGHGLQIGLFNKCSDLKGVQIGLWNRIGKKGFPIVNCRF